MRLLLIEDEDDLSHVLMHGLCQQGYAVDRAKNGEEGCEFASVNEYDLVILDLNLPDLDGLDVCRYLRVNYPHFLILMLTARGRPEERVTGLDAGADDYLIKPFHFPELLARIRALLRRDLRARQSLLQYKDLTLDPVTQTVWLSNRRLRLTRKELAILHYLMRRRGEVVSQEVLLEHVWDNTANPFTNTVRVHINALRRKLGDMTEPHRYIETVVGIGYRFGDADALENEV